MKRDGKLSILLTPCVIPPPVPKKSYPSEHGKLWLLWKTWQVCMNHMVTFYMEIVMLPVIPSISTSQMLPLIKKGPQQSDKSIREDINSCFFHILCNFIYRLPPTPIIYPEKNIYHFAMRDRKILKSFESFSNILSIDVKALKLHGHFSGFNSTE